MQTWEEYFQGEDYLSNAELEEIKQKYQPEFLNIRKKRYLLLFSQKRRFYRQYQNLKQWQSQNNEIFFHKQKTILRRIFQDIEDISLDLYQEKCVLEEEQAALIIAGAGSGKSLTILSKIIYLIEERGYKPNELLCLSFTNDSSCSLANKLKKHGYNVPVLTFHKLAIQILHNENFHIANPQLLSYVIQEFYHSFIFTLPTLYHSILSYFHITHSQYIDFLNSSSFLLLERKLEQFIQLFKSNFENADLLFSFLKKTQTKEEYTFLLHAIAVLQIYQIELQSTHSLDFNDFIQKAKEHLQKNPDLLTYRYLFVDEFQDCSLLRLQLLQEVLKGTKAKIFCVGDDFQSIYRFSGCNLHIFLHFQEYFCHSQTFFLQNTYRNSQQLIQIANSFIMKNKRQIPKSLSSTKQVEKPIKIFYYQKEEDFLSCLDCISQKNLKILVLGRNRKDILPLLSKDILYQDGQYYYRDLCFQYMTVHQSKGLEADIVIIIHLENSTMGFPNQLENDSVFRFVLPEQDSYAYEEERRLFYVALTRTKNENYLFVPQGKESIFVKELKRDYPEQIEILGIKKQR